MSVVPRKRMWAAGTRTFPGAGHAQQLARAHDQLGTQPWGHPYDPTFVLEQKSFTNVQPPVSPTDSVLTESNDRLV
jgi:hypothetical protein